MYEAAEAGIVTALRMFAVFQNEYRDLVISEVVNDYARLCQHATHAKKLLIEGRKNRESVVSNTREYMEAFRRLVETVEIVQASEGDLNAKRIQNQSQYRVQIINILITILLVLATALAAVLNMSS